MQHRIHTLLRKCDVTQGNNDWNASAGTDAVNSEWIVMPIDDWTDLGSFTPCTSINYGCTDISAANYDSTAVIDDGSCAYSDCAGIVGGTATLDDCGICHQAYIYNFVTHAVTFLNDTAGVVVFGTDIIVMPGDAGDP